MKKNKGFLIAYYVFLIVVLLSWTSSTTAPPLYLRLFYLIAVVAPAFFKRLSLFIPYTIFFTIASYSAAYSYMPSSLYIYALFAFLFFCCNYKSVKQQSSVVPSKTICFLLFLSLLVNLMINGEISNITWTFLIIIFLVPFLDIHDIKTFNLFSYSFIIVSFALSILFLVIGDRYAQVYSVQENLDRIGWIDPNYFSSIVGMGTMVSLVRLLSEKSSVVEKVFLVIALGLTISIIVLIASRGAILSLCIGCVILFITSKTNIAYKAIVISVLAVFVYYLYASSAFDLLLFRIEQDTNGGSGRLEIWKTKITAFIDSNNFWHYLFGFGFENSMNLGTNKRIGLHNDYFAFLIEYGIVGFISFISILIKPITQIKERTRVPYIFSLLIYLCSCIFTLEPMSLGIFVFYAFYIYICYYSVVQFSKLT